MTQEVNTENFTDIKRLVWIERILPLKLHPYAYLMRIDRPVGIWLLLLPGLWGITLATGSLIHFSSDTLHIIALFTIGAVIMRGAGCVINDLWDRDLDKLVERTRNRPLASGDLSAKQGAMFLATLLLIGLVVLLQFNVTTIILGFTSLPLIALYPLMKRITYWPQIFLGLAFNFGALMGWSAVTGSIGLPAIFLYIGGIFWTIAYDTIYAHQDKEDDLMAGVKSTALFFGDKAKLYVSGFLTGSIVFIALALLLSKGPYISALLLALPASHFIWQIKTWNPLDQSSSLKIFKANRNTGLLIWLALLF